jgi:hypothetical protein
MTGGIISLLRGDRIVADIVCNIGEDLVRIGPNVGDLRTH